jgi:peptidylprolyl isomerase
MRIKKTHLKIAIFIIAIFVIIFIIFNMNSKETTQKTKVKLETSQGIIVIELYEDMPITTGNFKNLVEKGTYDGVIFHRIIDNFMIQGGDPTGTGYGDPKIPNIKDEFTHEGGNKNNRGTISMANSGPNSGSSQFFLNLVDNNFLDGKHPAFGEIVEGLDIIDKIAKVETDSSDKPLEDVKIIKAEII